MINRYSEGYGNSLGQSKEAALGVRNHDIKHFLSTSSDYATIYSLDFLHNFSCRVSSREYASNKSIPSTTSYFSAKLEICMFEISNAIDSNGPGLNIGYWHEQSTYKFPARHK